MSIWKRYGFGWLMLVMFAGSLAGHWIFGWASFVDEQQALGQPPETGAFVNEMLRETFENWQSEFLQLLFQVAGLAFLLFVGSPASKEEDDRMEDKLDAILRAVDAERGAEIIAELDAKYPGRDVGPAAVT